jgi:hypothetical protein
MPGVHAQEAQGRGLALRRQAVAAISRVKAGGRRRCRQDEDGAAAAAAAARCSPAAETGRHAPRQLLVAVAVHGLLHLHRRRRVAPAIRWCRQLGGGRGGAQHLQHAGQRATLAAAAAAAAVVVAKRLQLAAAGSAPTGPTRTGGPFAAAAASFIAAEAALVLALPSGRRATM